MLTGDRKPVAERVARELGVDVVHAELHPEEKVNVVRKLQETHRHVAMVGDGVNDAPVLATANVGIAMGGASTEVALETADVVLMKEGLEYLPYAIALSKKARRVVLQNFVIALSVIAGMVTLNFFVHIPLTLGVLSHEGSTVVVILNGLRLLVPLDQKG
jgi:Cd2+/Zn2+-exporting ATPase